jgi:hypothetical protein
MYRRCICPVYIIVQIYAGAGYLGERVIESHSFWHGFIYFCVQGNKASEQLVLNVYLFICSKFCWIIKRARLG